MLDIDSEWKSIHEEFIARKKNEDIFHRIDKEREELGLKNNSTTVIGQVNSVIDPHSF